MRNWQHEHHQSGIIFGIVQKNCNKDVKNIKVLEEIS